MLNYENENIKTVPTRKLNATIDLALKTLGQDFITTQCDSFDVTTEGIIGDNHSGYTRLSGGREPWYKRGTTMRNERQLTLVSSDDLKKITQYMEIDEVKPEWIGANLVVGGIQDFTMLPPASLIFFQSGATLKIDKLNIPCRLAGASVAKHYPERDGLDLLFVKAARHLRGLTAWVECSGKISKGDQVSIRTPEHWVYPH